MTVEQKGRSNPPPETRASHVFGRLIWVFLGPLALLLLLMSTASRRNNWFTGIDVTYFIVLALVVLARWREQFSGMAKTVYGDPSTPAHFRRYIVVAPTLMIGAWLIVKVLGIYVWKDT